MVILFSAALFKKNKTKISRCIQPRYVTWSVVIAPFLSQRRLICTLVTVPVVYWCVKLVIDVCMFLCQSCCRNAFPFFLQGSQQNSYWGWSRQSVQLVRKRSAWPIGSWSLGEGRGGRQLLRLRSPFFTHWEASPLQELWTALLPEVSQPTISFGLFSTQNFRLGKVVAYHGTLLKDWGFPYQNRTNEEKTSKLSKL